jgi:hypothetical protein
MYDATLQFLNAEHQTLHITSEMYASRATQPTLHAWFGAATPPPEATAAHIKDSKIRINHSPNASSCRSSSNS